MTYILYLLISTLLYLLLVIKIDYRYTILIILGGVLCKVFMYDSNVNIADIEAVFMGIALGMIIDLIEIK